MKLAHHGAERVTRSFDCMINGNVIAVQVSIDVLALTRLVGYKAARNRTGRARMLKGAVAASVTSIEKAAL